MHLKTSSAKWRPFCPGGDELIKLFFLGVDVETANTLNLYSFALSPKYLPYLKTIKNIM